METCVAMKYNFFSEKSIIWTLIGLGLVIHFAWFGHPNSAVFDEVHFGKFISAYFTHEYYFDIHPPLGKLIIAGWGWLWGYQPGFSFANIGEVYPDRLYMALRFLPSLAGAFLPLLIYSIARRLRMSIPAAFLAGVFVALDNALLVQSRLILLDSFLLLFGFGAIWCYLRWRDNGPRWLLPIAGLLGGMAMSIKWTGMSFLALIAILEFIRWWYNRSTKTSSQFALIASSLIVIPIFFYYAVFALHFSLLYKSGGGDAFMTREFQHDLKGSVYATDPSIHSLSLTQKFMQLNREMYRSNQRLTATHPYSSRWYSWPFMARPIFYWVQGDARIYLLGNPIVWWLSTAGLLWLMLDTLATGLRSSNRLALLLIGAWLMNMLPFMGITRVMFLYHYFTALIWAILILALVVDRLTARPERPVLALTAVALILFVFFAPLSYGLSLSNPAYNHRVWLDSWR